MYGCYGWRKNVEEVGCCDRAKTHWTRLYRTLRISVTADSTIMIQRPHKKLSTSTTHHLTISRILDSDHYSLLLLRTSISPCHITMSVIVLCCPRLILSLSHSFSSFLCRHVVQHIQFIALSGLVTPLCFETLTGVTRALPLSPFRTLC